MGNPMSAKKKVNGAILPMSNNRVGNGLSQVESHGTNSSSQYIEHTWDLQKLISVYSHSGIDQLRPGKSNGLDTLKAKELLTLYGPNKLPSPKEISDLRLFLSQFLNLLWLLMVATSTLSLGGFLIERTDFASLYVSLILYLMIIVMCSLSFHQEREARKVVRGFQNLLPQSCSVVRDGNSTTIGAEELVVGDIIKIKSGTKVPADARILYCNQLKLETSSITGESEPIDFQSDAVDKNVGIFDAKNVAFNGSYCVDGEGVGVVVKTGVDTIIGQIASMTTGQPMKESHLQHQIKQFVKFLTFMAITVGTSVFVIGGFVHHWDHVTLLLVTAYSVCAVGMIPEGMPATVTSILTLVARRLAKKNVYLKQLDIVEALGSANIIASDKTGTLTKNEMTVTDVWYCNEYMSVSTSEHDATSVRSISRVNGPLTDMLVAMTICNAASFDDDSTQITRNGKETRISIPNSEDNRKKRMSNNFVMTNGNLARRKSTGKTKPRGNSVSYARKTIGAPSEIALIKYAEQLLDVSEFRRHYNVVFEVPFNSRRKFHLVIARICEVDKERDEYLLLMKGAPEILIQKCSSILANSASEEIELTDERLAEFHKAYETYAENGRRVIGFGHKTFVAESAIKFSMEQENFPLSELVFLGICAIMDPPREETEMAVRQCKDAGLKVFMVTGDHHVTATSIAKQIGLVDPSREHEWAVVKGENIPKLSDQDWDRLLAMKSLVFARTTPEQKYRIVEECQKRHQIIAMTGDGVNDAPALKKSNIGVGMGSGSDVAKEAADIVLVDDNFSSIVGAVEEGRLMFDNIKKLMAYVLTHTFPEVWAMAIKYCFGMPAGTSALMILSIDLGTEILPGIAMCWEPLEGDVMKRPPRKEGDNLIGKALILYCYGYTAHVQTLGCFIAYCAVFWAHGIQIRDLWMSSDYWKNGAPNFVSNGNVFTWEQQLEINAQACSAWQIGVVFGQVFHVFSTRTLRQSLFTHGFFSNKLMICAVVVELVILSIYVYCPGVNNFLSGAPPPWQCWVIVAAFGVFVFVYNELRKYCVRTWPGNRIVKIFTF